MACIGDVFGLQINQEMSRRTVGRAVEEGGVAARIQAAYKLSETKGVTISADSTLNCGLNIESAHMALCVADYTSGNLTIDPSSTPKTIDHTSAEAVRNWEAQIQECCDIFNHSPLARRLGRNFVVRDFMRILNGMHGDHASVEKGTASGLKDRKHDVVIQDLGEEALAGKEYMELVNYLAAWNVKKIAEAGGEEGWKALSPAEQAVRDGVLMKEIVTALGKEAYDALTPEERRRLDLFIWGRCCMHKDLNSFKGGNAEMMLEWKRLGQDGPVLLCNKQNASILRHHLDRTIPKDAVLTEDEFKAFETSTRGGVKACALAGAIFNNKDDKKGQGDRHIDFMTRKLGKQHKRFPNTSNTRFGSYSDASAELITHLPLYKEIVDVIQWSKHVPSLTNIEKNLGNSLADACTLTEFVAMVIYQNVITHPYMRQVRGPGTENVNLLDLGPLHIAIRDHIQSILDNPDIIFGSDISYTTATLDGKPWSNPEAMQAVFKLIPSLPFVKPITLAFFRGAQVTWIRFSAEFAPGGLIDLCTADERQQAWMTPTNDANEGELSGYRVAVRGKPSLTLHQYNALAMFRRNDTQAFMDAVFTDENHAYIMREARRIDASGVEAEKRRKIVDFRIQMAQMNKDKADAKAKHDAEVLEANLKRPLVSLREMDGLKVPGIVDQLNAYRARGVPNILKISNYRLKADKLAALKQAFEWYQVNGASLPVLTGVSAAVQSNPAIIEDWAAEEDVKMEE
ncbi:hypothetical protein MVEN_00335000 [Mycena venus]|uniref:Uncharacterized protein n=1 Tax=Mycena venus TaxID=2733690 RepID=A0A8H6YVK3_9AGAR|nr:hypothetical protein MVEN_00335000 [Mycena venus]